MGGSQGKKCSLEMGQFRDMENREPSGQEEFHSGGGQAAPPPVVGKLGGEGTEGRPLWGVCFSTVRRAAGCKVKKGVVRK